MPSKIRVATLGVGDIAFVRLVDKSPVAALSDAGVEVVPLVVNLTRAGLDLRHPAKVVVRRSQLIAHGGGAVGQPSDRWLVGKAVERTSTDRLGKEVIKVPLLVYPSAPHLREGLLSGHQRIV